MKHFSKLFFLTVLFFTFIFTGCNHGQEDQIVDLSVGWDYTLQNPFEEKAEFHKLYGSELDNLQNKVPGKKGSIWLRRTFVVPDGLRDKDISCYLGRITIADRTYLNGTLIGHEGFFPPYEFTAWNTARFYEIPESIIDQYGLNELLVEIYVDGEGSIVSRPYIGLHELAKKSAQAERFWNSQINAFFAFFMLIIAIYHFMVWLKNKKQKEALYFTIINIITIIYMVVLYLPEIPGMPVKGTSFLWFQKIFSSAMPFILPYMITSFVNEYLHHKDHKIISYLRTIFLVAPLVLILFTPNYVILRSMRTYIQWLLLPPMAYVIILLIIYCVKKQKDVIPLLLGFSPFLITAVMDLVIHDWMQTYTLPYFTSYGWQLVILSLLFVLASRFSSAKSQAEYLTQHLTDEVEGKTKALTESNKKLTSVNEELEKAKNKSEEELRLAKHIQQTFFPRLSPMVDDWDLAFKFMPALGVSRDLYDFFSDGRKLTGLSLFEVSDKGIGAGLVTMLAKNAISRKFTADMNIKLGSVMQNINETITEEKGDVKSYLTGILVRLDDSNVQLINAGNPVVFYKNARTGKCIPIKVKGQESGNLGQLGMIGIKDLKVNFTSINFAMNPGDALILYCKGLESSKNEENKEFGTSGICEAFQKSGDGTAQQKLDNFMASFNSFTKNKAPEDDITFIILQKK